jgi:hypothetical protein
MEITIFKNFNERKGNYELSRILNAIKEGRFKTEIENLRDCEDEKEKRKIKNSLLSFTPSMVLNNGRKISEGDTYSGLIHLDYDKIDDISKTIKHIKSIEFTHACFISPSGNGIKAFVRVSNEIGGHKDAFNILRNYYDSRVGEESDKSVKDLTRLCFVSHDPDLYLNEDSKVFNYLNFINDKTIQDVWEFTLRKESYIDGNRNNFIHLFACNANRSGIDINEVQKYCSTLSDSTISYEEIEKTIESAYDNNSHQFAEMQSVQFGQSGSKETDSPLIPDEVYENLPSVLKESCEVFKGRERDVYLTSALSIISGGLSNVQGLHDQNIVYPNLYSFIIAPAASGKGSMRYAQSLGNCYQSRLLEEYERAKSKYLVDLEVYNFKKKIAKKEEDIRNLKKPEEPKFQTFFIPGNTSSAMIHKHLEYNSGKGCISETETDTLTNALKQEWGGFSDVLRKGLHHETLSKSRITDLEYTVIEEPKFSLSITGTPDQVKSILSSTQNGLASRFIFYSFQAPPKWRKTYTKHISDSKQSRFMKFTQDLCDKFSNQNIIKFNLTESQGAILDKTYEYQLDEKYNSYLGDSSSLVKRLGLITYKIAMVLSAIRTDESILECSDKDFETAMKLTDVYLSHGLNVFETINNREGKLPLNDEIWINSLSVDFSTEEAIKNAEKLGIKERTAYKKLKKYVEDGIVQKKSFGQYKKIKLFKNVL